ncbi:BlaI/MecI/CopY family transcriptional regulator [Anaerotignum sp.]|uniref:BlaI/MecI/CopY family transcriptional regulator n=1 Tax=Anaerotignum sp. TaxID=2039241 RepID=UPI0028AC413F|nr:BlaI/MecI/CopY family transcriptional regulator [Anaerotignum sp.]
MKSLPQISDAEFEVMNIIWKYAPINTNDIVDQLSRNKSWNPKTIQTMLFRLEKKGVIVHEKESRIFVYSPLIKKEAYLEAEGKAFVNRFFDGALSQMVVNYLSKHELTTEDIDDMQAILDKKRKK